MACVALIGSLKLRRPGGPPLSQPAERPILSRDTVLSLYLPAAILALGLGIVLPALPVYAKSFGVSFSLASMVIVASPIGSLAAGVPTGYLLDRLGRRRVILAGPILAALASFLMATAQTFPELLFYRFLGGAATQMWSLGWLAIITDTGSDSQRGRQITGMHAMQSVGQVAGPFVGGVMATLWDVRVPFVLYGVLCLIAVVPGFLLIKETSPTARAEPNQPREARRRGLSLEWVLTAPILLFLTAQLVGAVTRGALQHGSLNFYAVYVYEVDAATIGFLGTAATALSIPIMVVSGAVMDRFGRKATILPGFASLAVALAFMALTAYNSWPFASYAVAFLVVVATNTITTGTMQTLGADIAPPGVRGSFFGLSQTVVQIGHIASPIAFALLSEHISAAAAFLFLAVQSLAVVVIVGLWIRDPVHARQKAEREAETHEAASLRASEVRASGP